MSANASDGFPDIENKDLNDSKRLQQSEAQLETSITAMLQQTAALQNLASKGETDEGDVDVMTRLRAKTRLLEHTAKWLSIQLATISCQINANKAVLSPVQRLPTELLSTIFLMSTPDQWYEAPSGTMALPCAAVSRAWRSVALQTSRLWNSIVIKAELRPPWGDEEADYDRSLLGANPALVSIVARYLIRSGHAPLQIVFHVIVRSASGYRDHPSSLSKTWDALVSASARWVSAELVCSLAFFDSRSAASFPRLQSLDIKAFGADTEGCHPVLFFQQSLIRALALRGDCTTPQGDLRWPDAWRPTRLEVQYIDSDSIPSILSAFASTVEHLIVYRERRYGLYGPPRTAGVRMPALRAVEIISPASEVILIDAPKLTEIVLRGHYYFAPDPTLDALFVRDRCMQLTSLTLDNVVYAVTSAVCLFKTMPALSHLSLSARKIGEDEPSSSDMVSVTLLWHLTRDHTRPESLDFLPALQHLELNARCDLYTIAYRVELVAPGMAMLRSRLRAGHDGIHDLRPLESFKSDMEELTLDRARAELAYHDLHSAK
ncbi:uncharacterized protein SCHCODRAFT_02748600 [Schizophyllum commune H4-8]|uniref:uncharacterized protein n=1 Tax=Schizophyllum commune (strain H4-8 / FGSC 9210) TaxID=578458 RepID=UPI0021607C6E|nr:uncharacterized protein SCHCODRAFT_02748600 [Schizophyllum commune H4-8]KAI5892370.1 hypothetical protein SCHCODRAFT_02748600 [Schizophyllum commune H4-8]